MLKKHTYNAELQTYSV